MVKLFIPILLSHSAFANGKVGMPVAGASASASASASATNSGSNARASAWGRQWYGRQNPQTVNYKRGPVTVGEKKRVQGSGGFGARTAKWLPWGAWNECTGVCGQGVQTRVRRCLNGVAGADCIGDTIGSKKCTNFQLDTCSYWSGWGAWSAPSASCNPAKRCKTRTCYGRNTDHCEGATELCESIIHPTIPCTQQVTKLPAEGCCPWTNPFCGMQQTWELCGPCYPLDQRRRLINDVPTPMPLCMDCIETDWELIEPECEKGARQVWRKWRKCDPRLENGAVVWGSEIPSYKKEAMPTVCSDAVTIQPCNGIMTAFGQCPGQIINKRQCQCYSELDTVDQFNQPLVQSETIPCGQPIETQKIHICDGTGNPIPAYAGLTESEISVTCNTICLNKGLKVRKLRINPCNGIELVESEVACGIVPPTPEPVLIRSEPCPAVTCQPDTFAREFYETSVPCTGAVIPETKIIQSCAIATCSDWSEWSTCDTSFPAACKEQERTRTRSCPCPGNQLVQTTTCAPVEKPAVVCDRNQPCLNREGRQCGPGIRQITCTDVCTGSTVINQDCNEDEMWKSETDACQCPIEGEFLGREWRRLRAQNPECGGITKDDTQYYCDTYNQDWLPWTEDWTAPTHECANQCQMFKYRCKTCDGVSGPACAAKYGAAAIKSSRDEGIPCGREIINEQRSECDSRCGQEGKLVVTRTDTCRSTVESRTESCTIPFVTPVPVEIAGPKNYRFGEECCGGSQEFCIEAIIDQGTICQARSCRTEDILPVDTGMCDVISDWSECKIQPNGFCIKEKTVKNVCGVPKPNLQEPCSLGLSPWTWVGGVNVNQWISKNPWNNANTNAYCQFGSDDPNMCSGQRTQARNPICKNDAISNYAPSEVRRSEPCGLSFVPSLVDLTPATIYANVPHYEPIGMWSECGMGVDLTTLAQSGTFVAEQVLIRRALCPTFKDVEIRRPCPICHRVVPGEWSCCSENCGVGKKIRYQMCLDKNGEVLSYEYGKPETMPCGSPVNYVMERGTCNAEQTCEGTTQQCGAGQRLITRRAVHAGNQDSNPKCAIVDKNVCQPLLDSLTTISSEPCDTGIPCPYWSAWSNVDYSQCHQEPNCLSAVPRFRSCQGRSEQCGCQGNGIQKVTCMPNDPLKPAGPVISTMNRDCMGKCPGTTYSTTQNFVCGEPVTTEVMCPGLVDLISPPGPWDRTCGQCDVGFISRSQVSLCTGLVVNTETQQCTPLKPVPEWSQWDDSACTACGGQMVRRRVYPCPELWPTEEQYTVCPAASPPVRAGAWAVCSRDCWKDESLMIPTTFASAAADQCGSSAAAWSYSSILGYESMNEVRSPGAWNDDGSNLASRPGYYPGYKGGWTTRNWINECTGETVRVEYKQCGTCKCPARLARSATAVQCFASVASCPATATASATAQCDDTILLQPECAHLKNHDYYLNLCKSGNNQVEVQCTANARTTAWSVWGTCVGANGLQCASQPGEMGTYFRTRFAGCGNSCQQESQSSSCPLPVRPDIVTVSTPVEKQCALGSGLGLMESIKTIKNGCTGAVYTEVLSSGIDISLMTNRYSERMVKACATTTQCGKLDVTREEYEVYDKCTQTSTPRYGNACKATVCPYFSAWQPWESCSKSCDEGVKRRIRYCVGGEVGEGFCVKGTDGALTVQTAPCNRGSCCNWEWSGWTGCCYNSVRSRAVRYRFQLACGADEVVGLQGDCFNSQTANIAQANAQANAFTGGAVAVASAEGRAIASCDNIGTDYSVWKAFHNPDLLQFSGEEFHVAGEVNVDMSDPTFAAVSRAYVSASASFKQITTREGWSTNKYYGGNTWNFPMITSAGSNASTGVSTGTGAIIGQVSSGYNSGSQTIEVGALPSSSGPQRIGMQVGQAPVQSSASASAGATAGASAGASASASAGASATSTASASGYGITQRNPFNWLWG